MGAARRRGGALPRRAASGSASGAAIASPRTCPTSPRRSIAFLATASLGAIWSSCAPEFGTRSVVDRFAQIEPTVLLAVDGYRYGEKVVDRRDEVRRDRGRAPDAASTRCTCSYLGDGARRLVRRCSPSPGRSSSSRSRSTIRCTCSTARARPGCRRRSCTATAASSSSTSRRSALHHDLGAGDRFFWFTTTGWMMWNYLVSRPARRRDASCCSTATPRTPTSARCGSSRPTPSVDVFGVSAPFLMACRKAGVVAAAVTVCAVDRLDRRTAAARRLPLGARRASAPTCSRASVSGGTDVCAAFVGAVPLLPGARGRDHLPLLGCAVEAFDADGAPCPPGVQGELVVTEPMPSMPVGFWGDADGAKLRAAYFDDYPGRVAPRRLDHVHRRRRVRASRAAPTPRSTAAACASAPATSTRSSKACPRSPTASSCTSRATIPTSAMGELVLFVALAPGATLDDDLRARASCARCAPSCRRATCPTRSSAVPAIPRTLSGKKLEVPVKRILGGADADAVASRSSLADPDRTRLVRGVRRVIGDCVPGHSETAGRTRKNPGPAPEPGVPTPRPVHG